MTVTKKKRCTKCRKYKPLADFPKASTNADGHRSDCRICNTLQQEQRRRSRGVVPMNTQHPGEQHLFPCGCAGVLPMHRGQSNKFAVTSKNKWYCRVSQIIDNSNRKAGEEGYKPILPNTAHSLIRKIMEELNCERCKEPLEWILERGKTPHLHHSHTTGEIRGFTHSRCNPLALERRIEQLEALVPKS